ncbi:MAG: OsmC family protein [Deltaproteobacteria bacterium]|nr:OsmC family protein [Deltaproteobacteria bacterium]
MFSQLTRYASELDVPIEEAEMDIRMRYDTRGKLLLAEVSPGAQAVDYVFEIKSPAPPEKIKELVQMIEKGCHTINTIRNPTPVSARVIHNGVEIELAG